MPRLRKTALEARFPSPNSDHDRGERRWKHPFSPSKKSYLSGGNHAWSASPRRRYYAVRIVRRRRRSPCALDKGHLCYIIGQASNRKRASSETKIGAPRQCCRWCRTAVKLSIAVTECARLARVSISARVMSGSKAHSRIRSGRGQKRRASTGYHHRDPTCVCVIVVAVYLALILVVPSRLT